MSNSDNFIDEVASELRRERFFTALRRFGWIGLLLVVVVVAGAAWTEWQRNGERTSSRQFGDALTAALSAPTPEARREALAAAPVGGEREAVVDLMLASDPAEDKAATIAALDESIADTTLPALYRDLAVLRKVIVAGVDIPIADRRTALDEIAVAGRPYRTLALEQIAYLNVEAGETQAAIDGLIALVSDQEATPALRQRASQMVTALGGEISAG